MTYDAAFSAEKLQNINDNAGKGNSMKLQLGFPFLFIVSYTPTLCTDVSAEST